EQSRSELIQRIRGEEAELAPMPSDDPEKKAAKQNGMQQLEAMLGRLGAQPPTGRMVVHISANAKQWEGGPNDVVVHSGDALLVPKMPNFVQIGRASCRERVVSEMTD